MCSKQCFCQTNMIHPILGITLLNNALLESKHHSSDSKDRTMQRNKNLTQQVAGTWEPSTLVNDACFFPLNTCGYEHSGDKDRFWIRATLTHTIITATSQNNITPKGITNNKPSPFLIFQAFETWVLAMESQPEYNRMLYNQFPWLTYFSAVAFIILEHTLFQDPRHSLPANRLNWSTCRCNASASAFSDEYLTMINNLNTRPNKAGVDPHQCNCLYSTNFSGIIPMYQSVENVTQSIKAEILCKCWFISALSLEFIQRAFTLLLWIA